MCCHCNPNEFLLSVYQGQQHNGVEIFVVKVFTPLMGCFLDGHMLPIDGPNSLWNIPSGLEDHLQFLTVLEVGGAAELFVLQFSYIYDGPAHKWLQPSPE